MEPVPDTGTPRGVFACPGRRRGRSFGTDPDSGLSEGSLSTIDRSWLSCSVKSLVIDPAPTPEPDSDLDRNSRSSVPCPEPGRGSGDLSDPDSDLRPRSDSDSRSGAGISWG